MSLTVVIMTPYEKLRFAGVPCKSFAMAPKRRARRSVWWENGAEQNFPDNEVSVWMVHENAGTKNARAAQEVATDWRGILFAQFY